MAFSTAGRGWKPFNAKIAVKKDGGGEEIVTCEILAKDPEMAKYLVTQRYNKNHGSANWRFV